MKSVCADCGTVYEREKSGSKCDDCKPTEKERARYTPKMSARQNGYDSAWDRLSKRARELSPLCEECGRTDDLTTDHTPEAWERKAAGKTIRLQDVRVLCREHNSSAGAARGPRARPRVKPYVWRRTDDHDDPPPF